MLSVSGACRSTSPAASSPTTVLPCRLSASAGRPRTHNIVSGQTPCASASELSQLRKSGSRVPTSRRWPC